MRLLWFILLFLSFSFTNIQAQGGPPPPCGLSPVNVCDEDFDGQITVNLRELFPFNFCNIDPALASEYLPLTYYLTEEDANNAINAIPNPESFSTTESVGIHRRADPITSTQFGVLIDSDDLAIVNPPTPNPNIPVLEVCDDDGDGFSVFDLTVLEPLILNGEANVTPYYFENQTDALTGTNFITDPSNYSNITPSFQTIYVRVERNFTDSCFTIVDFQLLVNPVPVLSIDDISICPGGSAVVDTDLSASEYSFLWSLNGTVLSEQGPSLTVTEEGLYTVDVINNSVGCSVANSFNVTFGSLAFNQPSFLVACSNDGTGIGEFDLSTTVAEITNGFSNLTVSFYLSQADADAAVNPIPGTLYTNTTPFNEVLYARIDDTTSDCYATAVFELIISGVEPLPTISDLVVCDNNMDGIAEFNLNSKNQEVISGQSTAGFLISYHLTETDAINRTNELISPYTNTSNPETIFVSVADNNGCNVEIGSFNLVADGTCVTCLEPSMIQVTNITGNSAEIGWTSNSDETEWEIVVQPSGTGIPTGNGTSITTNPYTVTGLSGTTQYEIYIRAVCQGPTFSDWTGDINFTTPILSPQGVTCSDGESSFLFTAEFDSFDGWTGDITNSDQSGFWEIPGNSASGGTGPNSAFSGANYMNYEASGGATSTASAVSPAIDLTTAIDGAELSFYMHAYGTGMGTLNVGIATDASGPFDQVFTWSGQLQTSGADDWTPVGVNLDAYLGDVIYIEFSHAGIDDFEGDMSIDFVRVESCGDFCFAPSNITASNITATSADLAWTPNSNEASWEYVVQPAGTGTPNDGIAVTTPSASISGLEPATDYEIYVLANCAGGDSIWAGPATFSTNLQFDYIVDCQSDDEVVVDYCYGNSDTNIFTYTSANNSPLTLVFNSGQVENNWDELIVLDSDGSELYNDYGTSGDISGLVFQSTGNSISWYINSDSTISCETNGFNSINATVNCDNLGQIRINAFSDTNSNGIFDTNETNFLNGYFTYEVNNDGVINTVQSSQGRFNILSETDTDSYDFNFYLFDDYLGCYTLSVSQFENISVLDGETIFIDFPVVENNPPCQDAAVYLINPFASPRPGFEHSNLLFIENLSESNIASGSIEFTLDEDLLVNDTLLSSPNLSLTSTATGFTIDFVNLGAGMSEFVDIILFTPATVPLGEIVTNTATYTTNANDTVTNNNFATLSETVIGSYDPNDKMEAYGPEIVFDDFVTTDEYLYYTIRFQNVGTAEAIFVRIEDVLDTQLDASTFQMLRSSHDYVVTRTGNNLEWFFGDINLPAEQDDPEGSIGYVHFRIKPNPGYMVGDIIPNNASIFFDFNAPIITNTFTTEFIEPLSINDFEAISAKMYPNPAGDEVSIQVNSADKFEVLIYDIQGKQILVPHQMDSDKIDLNLQQLDSGIYFVHLESSGKLFIQKLVVK